MGHSAWPVIETAFRVCYLEITSLMLSRHQVTLNLHGLGEPPDHIPSEDACYWLPAELFVEVLDRVAHVPHVRLTFDDGNASDFEVAVPELVKRGLRAEFFVLAGRIGRPGYLEPSNIREMVSAGMGVGLHGMDHRSWAQCDGAELEVEIDEARRQIESITGKQVTRAACPFGAYNASCLRKLRTAGFERVYTSDGGVARAGDWLHTRNTLVNDHGIGDIEALSELRPAGFSHLSRRLRTFVKSRRRRLPS